jgi:hypothetical protein
MALVVILASIVLTFALIRQNPSKKVAASAPTATATLVTNTSMPQYPFTYTDVWPTSASDFFDSAHRYHMKGNGKGSGVSLAFFPDAQIQDFTLSVTMFEIAPKEVNMTDFQGVVFRVSSDQTRYYMFEIAPYSGGQYDFESYSEYSKEAIWTHIDSGTSNAILPGVNNTIKVVARGNTFSISVNGKFIMQKSIGTPSTDLQSGMIGLYVEDPGEEVAFSQLTVDVSK